MSKFTWVRNPTIINGLATLYVSKRGSDTLGDGTAEYPYASIAKATSVATANTNIMLDDGEWNEARTSNNRAFNWWGNAKTKIYINAFYNDAFSFFYYIYIQNGGSDHNLRIKNCAFGSNSTVYESGEFLDSIILENLNASPAKYTNCIITKGMGGYYTSVNYKGLFNCIVLGAVSTASTNYNGNNCNFVTQTIPSRFTDSINDATTGQTLADYFNHVHPNVLANPSTATIDDWLQCDFTAKAGSKNIGAGEKGNTIGLNEGFTMYADNSANDVFSPSNGATLKNIAWDNTLNGYTLVQKENVSPLGGTFGAHTITLDSSASSENGYYVGLFIGIVGGKGYGQTRLITNYNGASRLCGVDRDWDIVPDSNSVYTISGTIVSAVKDLGKVIKVKRNWTFMDMTALSDGKWSQFLTHKTEDGEMFPTSSYQWEYSMDGNFWYQGSTADDLVSATDGENKVYDNTYGDCSADFYEENAKPVTMRYIRVSVHIGFNIGE